jgi:hypothetical protein
MDRPPQSRARPDGRRGEAGGDEALHVGGAAPVQPPALLGEDERVGAPVLPVDRHDIGMAGEHHPAVALRPEGRKQIRLGAGIVVSQPHAGAAIVQIVGHPPDQRMVRVARGRVEPDQLAQD